jgi:hypothetical protein
MKNINKSIAMMIKIAKKLDDKNLFYHSDKLFKIAQQAAVTPPAQNIILNSNQKMSEFANRSRKIIEAKANWTENMKILSDKIAYILNK